VGKEALGPESIPFLMTTGNIDSFGFFARNKDFAENSQVQGAPINWIPTTYDHGVFDVDVLADYIMK